MTRTCPTHPGGPRELPITEFGVNRSTKDGRNLYCKTCRRDQVAQSRSDLRELKKKAVARKRNVVASIDPNLTPMGQRVLWAIDSGAVTRKDIVKLIRPLVSPRMRKARERLTDEIGEGLGELFNACLISTEGEYESRIYFRKKVA